MQVTIANLGNAPTSGIFYFGAKQDWYIKPGYNDSDLVMSHTESLAPGEIISRTFRIAPAQSWQLAIDHFDSIEESNEENNIIQVVNPD